MALHRSSAEIARITHISQRTVRRVVALWKQTGKIEQRALPCGRPRELDSWDTARTPDMYLAELRDALLTARGIDVDESTISRTLHRRGFSRKKVTRAALERNEELRNQFQLLVGANLTTEMLVFLDEAACNRHTFNRPYAWSPAQKRARRWDFFVRGQRYCILPAISLDGVLHLDILTSSWTAESFEQYVDALLDEMNPYPMKNSVLVMDNAAQHHFDGLREMVEARGMRLLYLPPYSPDFNPIEEGFSAMKAWLKRNRDFASQRMMAGIPTNMIPFQMLWAAVYDTMTPTNIHKWFADCGYIV